MGPVSSFCENGNEPSVSLKRWDILEWLSDRWRFREDTAARKQPVNESVTDTRLNERCLRMSGGN
jgi:hypothetical protein